MRKRKISIKTKIKQQFLPWGLISVLAILIVIQFVYISKTDSKSLKSEIRSVDANLRNELSQLKNKTLSNESNLDSIKSSFRNSKNDSTSLILITEIDKRINRLETKVEFLSNVSENDSSSNWELWLAFGLTWLFLIVLIIIFRKKGSNSVEFDREKVINAIDKSQRITNKFYSREHNNFPQSIRKIENDIESLMLQVKALQNHKNGVRVETITEETKSDEIVVNTQTKNENVVFFKSKNGKILTEELQNSTEASFKLYNINDNEAEFSYCGGVVNQDFFTDVCSFANNPSDVPNKTKITTTTPGVVKKDSNNKWEVTEKAKIKFE